MGGAGALIVSIRFRPIVVIVVVMASVEIFQRKLSRAVCWPSLSRTKRCEPGSPYWLW